MSDIIGQVNEITKRFSVLHAMALLPSPIRARFWHEGGKPVARMIVYDAVGDR